MFGLFDLLPFLNGVISSTVINLVAYAALSYGIFCLAKKHGLTKTWMAWVPLARLILLGDIADLVRQKKSHTYRTAILITVCAYAVAALVQNVVSSICGVIIGIAVVGFFVGYLLGMVLMMSPLFAVGILILLFSIVSLWIVAYFIGRITRVVNGVVSILALAYYVIQVIALHNVYKRHDNDRAVLYTVLSVLFRFAPNIILPIVGHRALTKAEPAAEVNEEAPAEITA